MTGPSTPEQDSATLRLGVHLLRLPCAGSPLMLRRDRPFDTTAEVMDPADVLRYVATAREVLKGPLVLEIAGPGDALASPETVLKALALVHEHHPDVLTGLEIDGPLLAEFDEEFQDFGLNYVALRMDAADVATAQRLVDGAIYKGDLLDRDAAAQLMIDGIRKAFHVAELAGIAVAVRTTLIPTINGHEIDAIAGLAARLGAQRIDVRAHAAVEGAPLQHAFAPGASEVEHAQQVADQALLRARDPDAPPAPLGWLDPTRLVPADLAHLDAVDPLALLPEPDTTTGPAGVHLPRRRAQWVAVASRDGTLVDIPLAQATQLRIYRIDEESIRLLGVRNLAKDARRRIDGVGDARVFLRALTGCRALVAKGLPARARALLQAVGMRGITSEGSVEATLDRVARGTLRSR